MGKIVFNSIDVNKLKQQVINKAGFAILTKPDCLRLSSLLLNAGAGYISETTIYRIFLKEDNLHVPYKSTLDILCKYLGYYDIVEYIRWLNDYNNYSLNKNVSDIALDSLLVSCIKNQNFKTLSEYFEILESESKSIKECVVLNMFDVFASNDFTIPFFKEFSDNKFVREWFLESGHDPKFRIPNYDQAYLFYLKKVNCAKDSSELQQYVFANSVLFRSSFLNKDYVSAVNYGSKLYDNTLTGFNSNSLGLQLFPLVRYVSYKLWYLHLVNAPKVQLLDYTEYLLEFAKLNIVNADSFSRKIVFNTLGEVLFYSKLPFKFQLKFKNMFEKDFHDLNIEGSKYQIIELLPYLQPNGLLNHRP